MGIYIKGVAIPTNCTDCRYMPLVGCNPYQDNGMSPSDHRHRTCPLTEVAEPHGRLIDADALADDLETDGKEFGDEMKLNCASWLRSNATLTVIERSDYE